MATQTKVELIDDLTGDKADETVIFGLDGREFEIDLSRDHAGELRDNLARYLAKARKVGKLTAASTTSKRTASGQRQSREQTAAIREWRGRTGITSQTVAGSRWRWRRRSRTLTGDWWPWGDNGGAGVGRAVAAHSLGQ